MKIRHHRSVMTAVILLVGLISYAQQQSNYCSTNEVRKKTYASNPEIKKEQIMSEAYTASYVKKLQAARENNLKSPAAASYTIPVVFHVLHNNGLEKISVEQCQSALDRVNEDFNGLNSDWATIDPLFDGIKQSMDIQFCLASIDPDGNPTAGITYHLDNACGQDEEALTQYAWDNQSYMEVYIVRDVNCNGDTTAYGYALDPSSPETNDNKARVVYNHKYLGNNGTSIASTELQSVFTHNIGHWLKLLHTYETGCDGDGDAVADTPNTIGKEGCGWNVTSSCGNKYNAENYMDFNICYKMFTQGQIDRMIATLESGVGSRNELWSEVNLLETGCSGGSVPMVLVSNQGKFDESINNDGSISSSITLNVINELFSKSSGSYNLGTEVLILNVPPGLTPSINVLDSTTLEFTLTGNANFHEKINSINDMNLVLTDAVFTTYKTSEVSGATRDFTIDFIDTYRIICIDLDRISINESSTWQEFSANVGDANYALWRLNANHNDNPLGYDMLKIETYDKGIICHPGNRNIALLDSGAQIGASQNYTTPATHPGQNDLANINYTDWHGKTAYAGITFTLNNHIVYGWLEISVSEDGSTAIVHRIGYDEEPGAMIQAGSCIKQNAVPIADFTVDDTTLCPGTVVHFSDQSQGNPENWLWSFPGGQPSFSTEQNPVITYYSPGYHDVSLTVSKSQGGGTKTETGFIHVGVAKELPFSESFEGVFPPENWVVNNPDNSLTWEKRSDVGNNSPSCMIMNNADNAMVGEIDEIILPALDFSYQTFGEMRFDVAYTKYDDNSPDILKVEMSLDCGNTWSELWVKDHMQLETVTVPTDQSNDWVPSETNNWREELISIDSVFGESYVLIRFHNISGYGTRIWIDNIQINNQSLEIEPFNSRAKEISIFPNPGNGLFHLKIASANPNEIYNVSVKNIIGQTIFTNEFIGKSPDNLIDLSKQESGVYFVILSDSKSQKTLKIIKN